MGKIRLDELLLRRGLSPDLQHARRIIGAGEVTVNGECADKAGTLFPADTLPELKSKCPYVSRGGYKLQGGLSAFSLDPTGFICVDIGASSGGFTDCLLQHGAQKVYAVDVAYGQLDWKLRQDDRVIVIERFNARNISREQIPEDIDLAVIDAAFISLTRLLPPLLPLFGSKDIAIIALVKPQFELPRELIPRGGVVTNPVHHQQAVDKITDFAKEELGLHPHNSVSSPILGPKGNREFLLYLSGS